MRVTRIFPSDLIRVRRSQHIRYGAFLNTVIEFLIVAMSVFVIVKFMNRLIRNGKRHRRSLAPGLLSGPLCPC